MDLIDRALRSLRQRGLARTVDAVGRYAVNSARSFLDRRFDLVHGTDTSRIAEPWELRVEGPNRSRGIRYQPTRAKSFVRLMRALRLPKGQIFVDIGAGKGRVLMLALDFHFRKVVGVEYAADLCDIAARNLAIFGRGKRRDPAAVVHCCDAAEYRFVEGETVIYMFNPFDSVVLERMLIHLRASLSMNPRKAWLIYHFPRWSRVIESQGLFERSAYYRFGSCEFMVYEHEPPGTAKVGPRCAES